MIDEFPEVCDNSRPCAVHDQPHPLIGRLVHVVSRRAGSPLHPGEPCLGTRATDETYRGVLRAVDPDGVTITTIDTYQHIRVSPVTEIIANGSDIHPDHPLLGKRVAVTYGSGTEKHTRTGILLDLTDDGDVDLRTDSGTIHYIWPMIDITEAPA